MTNDNSANNPVPNLYRASAADFKKIPGSPIAYWLSNNLTAVFAKSDAMSKFFECREGLTTGNNEKYVMYWNEVSLSRIRRNNPNRDSAINSGAKWFPYNKGGEFRKWAGNDDYVVDWFQDGYELQNTLHPLGKRIWAHNFNLDFIFKNFISWSDITTKGLSVRLFPQGYLFDATGLSAFIREHSNLSEFYAMALCNSPIGSTVTKILNPTMHFKSGDFAEIPVIHVDDKQYSSVEKNAKEAVRLESIDWHSYETSWDFTTLPLLQP